MTAGYFAAEADELPRRSTTWNGTTAEQPLVQPFDSRPAPTDPMLAAARGWLTDLQLRVPGVRGCVVAGFDGLLITHNLPAGRDPHDLSALAATTVGLGRQCGLALGQGQFRDTTIRSQDGYFTVYVIAGRALLAVLGDDGLNVARLHIEVGPVAAQLSIALPE